MLCDGCEEEYTTTRTTAYGELCPDCEVLAKRDEAELKAEHHHFHEQVTEDHAN